MKTLLIYVALMVTANLFICLRVAKLACSL